jgi:hypothetical protein
MVEVKVPLPKLVRVAVPVALGVADASDTVALTVSVVEVVVAAFVMAPAKIAKAHVLMIAVMDCCPSPREHPRRKITRNRPKPNSTL